MDQMPLVLLVAVAAIGVAAVVAITRRKPAPGTAGAAENPFAASTEGMKRCPSCGVGNLVTERNCSSCGRQPVWTATCSTTPAAPPYRTW